MGFKGHSIVLFLFLYFSNYKSIALLNGTFAFKFACDGCQHIVCTMFYTRRKGKKQVVIKFRPSAFNPCNKVIQLGLVTSMPFPFLLKWYEISLLFTLEVMVAFLMRMHMEFDWLKLGPGP